MCKQEQFLVCVSPHSSDRENFRLSVKEATNVFQNLKENSLLPLIVLVVPLLGGGGGYCGYSREAAAFIEACKDVICNKQGERKRSSLQTRDLS